MLAAVFGYGDLFVKILLASHDADYRTFIRTAKQALASARPEKAIWRTALARQARRATRR
jgi:hypothetical protein